MSKTGSEEKFPLLLYFVESNEDLSKTNKRLYLDKGRFQGITSGATAVFRQFPNYIDTCWVTTALSGLLFFMLVLLMLSTISSGGHRIPRCIVKEEISNNTVHLVHSYDPGEWQSVELDLFEKIVQNYPKYKIHLILIQRNIPKRIPKYERNILDEVRPVNTRTTSAERTVKTSVEKMEEKLIVKRDAKRKKRKIDDLRLSINMGAKRLLDILLHNKASAQNATNSLMRTPRSIEKPNRVRTLNDVLRFHSNIIVENTTFNQVFYMSPLYAYWPFLNENLKVFAVRVLQLWQYGGISFDLEPSIKKPNKSHEPGLENKTSNEKDIDNIFNRKLLNFIISETKNYERLPTGVVTADDEALHMESKIPCHAFFGEIMMNLRKAQDDTTVKEILQESLRVFCKHSAADKKYCDILTKIQ